MLQQQRRGGDVVACRGDEERRHERPTRHVVWVGLALEQRAQVAAVGGRAGHHGGHQWRQSSSAVHSRRRLVAGVGYVERVLHRVHAHVTRRLLLVVIDAERHVWAGRRSTAGLARQQPRHDRRPSVADMGLLVRSEWLWVGVVQAHPLARVVQRGAGDRVHERGVDHGAVTSGSGAVGEQRLDRGQVGFVAGLAKRTHLLALLRRQRQLRPVRGGAQQCPRHEVLVPSCQLVSAAPLAHRLQQVLRGTFAQQVGRRLCARHVVFFVPRGVLLPWFAWVAADRPAQEGLHVPKRPDALAGRVQQLLRALECHLPQRALLRLSAHPSFSTRVFVRLPPPRLQVESQEAMNGVDVVLSRLCRHWPCTRCEVRARACECLSVLVSACVRVSPCEQEQPLERLFLTHTKKVLLSAFLTVELVFSTMLDRKREFFANVAFVFSRSSFEWMDGGHTHDVIGWPRGLTPSHSLTLPHTPSHSLTLPHTPSHSHCRRRRSLGID